MHRPFDKGKHDVHAFIFKTFVFTKHPTMFQTSSSRNIFLCFNLRIFELSTVCDTRHQLCGMLIFDSKITNLNWNLTPYFIRIVFENASFTKKLRVRNFHNSFVFRNFFSRDPVSFVSCFSFVFWELHVFMCNFFASCVF